MLKKSIINPKPIDMIISTEYGNIEYEDWCEREAKRIGNCKLAYKNMVFGGKRHDCVFVNKFL